MSKQLRQISFWKSLLNYVRNCTLGVCPESHPYASDDGNKCCSTKDANSCSDIDIIACPNRPCDTHYGHNDDYKEWQLINTPWSAWMCKTIKQF